MEVLRGQIVFSSALRGKKVRFLSAMEVCGRAGKAGEKEEKTEKEAM